jgi:arylsulfatase A-like enzyme
MRLHSALRTGHARAQVDVYPTLAELAGLPDPRALPGSEGINGTSLAPAMADPTNTSIKTAAFSQFSKNNVGTSVQPKFSRNATKLMGYSIRTQDWRYTAWCVHVPQRAENPAARLLNPAPFCF